MSPPESAFWSIALTELLRRLNTTAQGLAAAEAATRLAAYAPRRLKPRKRSDAASLLFAQFRSPLVLILCLAVALSFSLGNRTDSIIILAIVVVSALLGFWQERGAATAVERLLAMVRVRARVLRDGTATEVALDEVVPGDVVLLSAGRAVPGDCLLLESTDLYVNEATLTGETFPAEKNLATLPADTPLNRRSNALFMGTQVVSGSASALVVQTGRDTEFGKVSERLKLRPPETEFERGVRRFGYPPES